MMSAPASTREHRMLTTLLATCDPCGYLDQGEQPFRYNTIAGEILQLLRRRRYSTVDIMMKLPGDADAVRALQFASAASDWWSAQQDKLWRTRVGLSYGA